LERENGDCRNGRFGHRDDHLADDPPLTCPIEVSRLDQRIGDLVDELLDQEKPNGHRDDRQNVADEKIGEAEAGNDDETGNADGDGNELNR